MLNIININKFIKINNLHFPKNFQSFIKVFTKFSQFLIFLFPCIRMKMQGEKMINKPKLIKLGNEIPQKTLNTLIKSYNGIKCYLVVDEENPNNKYGIYLLNEDNKIVRDNKGKAMKQNEFQQYVINEFKEFKDFKNYVTEKFDEQDKTNKLILNKLDNFEKYVKEEFKDIKYRLTRLESFHEEDIKNYELANKDLFKKNTN